VVMAAVNNDGRGALAAKRTWEQDIAAF
jgi:hypothetical protein